MVRLVMILLGVDYLRTRWKALMLAGWLSVALGVEVFIDMMDGSLYFPLKPFAFLLLLEGLSTLAVAWTGMGGQRKLRYVKGSAFTLAATLILIGTLHANFILAMIFGTLFFADGVLQIISARIVRFRRWRLAIAGGVFEMMVAFIFYLPYPVQYAGTIPYCVSLGLLFGGWNMILLAMRVRRMEHNPAVADSVPTPAAAPETALASSSVTEWDGPPSDDERALTIHVWMPAATAKAEAQPRVIVNRYIAAVDRNGAISTGHAALESPEGIYISLYPGTEIDRSPEEFGRILRATRENDVPGVFQPDYRTEANAWCESTVKVRIRNYDPERLQRFWDAYRQDTTYNLTYRNCSSTVARGLEAAIEGASARVWAKSGGWRPLVRVMSTPELWVAAQVRKRAATMAWTPGLTLDYARALSMLADPRPLGWIKMARLALKTMYRSRRRWQPAEAEQASASDLGETSAQGATRTEA
ncbi:membrane protein [Caballeronia choica]|jgi:uncharacterized membrane protein HdeD (DUF308 family)|uniref:Membrane protein n=1 Tax=Caballeronia choica TaxID=326476 RepID=A0A158KR46_9BURK|nr:hypothetical protein [Caballeronia choica]SAL83475.1 membrane protein [Caballeronia choica]